MLSFLKNNLSPPSEVKETKIVEKVVEKVDEATETLEWKELTFDIIRNIRDPEKPETLEELDVVQEDLIEVTELTESPGRFVIKIAFVPTVPHCSLATLIGLCIRTKLQQELPEGKFKIDIHIKEGSHSTADEITKQINDKERVAAALENPSLKSTVDECINHEID